MDFKRHSGVRLELYYCCCVAVAVALSVAAKERKFDGESEKVERLGRESVEQYSSSPLGERRRTRRRAVHFSE